MESYDAVIVGAGLAGLQCARLLAGQGLSVLLLDRKTDLTRRIHTTGIFVRRTLEDFDIPETCLGPGVRSVHLHSPSGKALCLDSERTEFRVGRMGRLYSQWLSAAIQSGAVWRPGTSFVDAKSFPESDSSIITTESGSALNRVASRFLIGADGAVSRVASALELSENRHWIVGVESVYRTAGLEHPPRLDCFLDPRLAPGYLAWVAMDGEEAHVGVGGYPDRFQPREALSEFLAGSARSVCNPDGWQLMEQRGGRIPVGGVLPRIASPRGMLVGDAAGAVSPLTAGGLDPCLRLSALAAQVASRYLESGDSRVLSAYQGNHFRKRFRTRRMYRRLASMIRYRWMANAACFALRTAPLHRVAARIFFGPGSFPITREEIAPILGARTQHL